MPVPRSRGEEEKVDYVVVRRTVLDGAEETGAVEIIPTPTATVDHLLDRSNIRREPQPTNSRDDNDSDDDDSDQYQGPPPVPVFMTITLPKSQATGGALAAEGPTETVVVTFSPPPRPEQGAPPRRGISQTTEHLLIAAGSIGKFVTMLLSIDSC
jgi:hypothetical protein